MSVFIQVIFVFQRRFALVEDGKCQGTQGEHVRIGTGTTTHLEEEDNKDERKTDYVFRGEIVQMRLADGRETLTPVEGIGRLK